MLPEKSNATLKSIERIYQQAQHMLTSAIKADCDLGIIVSG
jgi:hypothetical protein